MLVAWMALWLAAAFPMWSQHLQNARFEMNQLLTCQLRRPVMMSPDDSCRQPSSCVFDLAALCNSFSACAALVTDWSPRPSLFKLHVTAQDRDVRAGDARRRS